MKIVSGLIVFLYTIVFLALGLLFVGISFEIISIGTVSSFLTDLYANPLYLLYVGLIGLGLLILAFGYIYSILKRKKRKKVISIQNPNGEVSIALSAIEDFVQRIASNVTEIKSLTCKVISMGKGIKVINKVDLIAGISIPELTEKFQEMIKLRLQEMLGIEGNILIKMYVRELHEDQNSSYDGEIDYSK